MRSDPAALAARLLRWYQRNRRDLPWRKTRDPWAIWVSEVMLQQTRVAVVEAAWPRFMARFPDPASLARADDEALLSAWKGLGYYRRARLLRDGARRVVDEHDGAVPDDPEALAALPGVGAYTRGALCAIAFDRPWPAIDGNVERVAARMLALDAEPRQGEGRRRVAGFVEALLPEAPPAELCQALMELGALVCTPRTPRCAACPWAADCAAAAAGRPETWPKARPRDPALDVETALVLAEHEGRVLARRREPGEYNAGQWCLPGLGLPGPAKAPADLGAALVETLARDHGLARPGLRKGLAELGSFRHAITRFRIRARVFALAGAPRRAPRGLRWIDPSDPELPVATALRKALALARKCRASPAGAGKRSRS